MEIREPRFKQYTKTNFIKDSKKLGKFKIIKKDGTEAFFINNIWVGSRLISSNMNKDWSEWLDRVKEKI